MFAVRNYLVFIINIENISKCKCRGFLVHSFELKLCISKLAIQSEEHGKFMLYFQKMLLHEQDLVEFHHPLPTGRQ